MPQIDGDSGFSSEPGVSGRTSMVRPSPSDRQIPNQPVLQLPDVFVRLHGHSVGAQSSSKEGWEAAVSTHADDGVPAVARSSTR